MPRGSGVNSYASTPRKELVDPELLKDQELKAYLLGYLFSDGSVKMIRGKVDRVGFYSSDREVLVKIAGRLKVEPPEQVSGGEIWALEFYGENARLFYGLGLQKDKENNTLEGKDLRIYPFLRGFLDGDGGLYCRETRFGKTLTLVRFLVRRKLMGEIVAFLRKEGFQPSISRVNNGSVVVVMHIDVGGRSGFELLERIYGGATIFLQRKYERYMTLRETYHSEEYRAYLKGRFSE